MLLGRVNPSGRLSETFPVALADTPAHLDFPGDGDGRSHFTDRLFTGYRSYDARGIEPLFPFGHGLSYTTFEYSGLRVDGLTVTVAVRNTGERAGAEVVQLYVRERAPRLRRPDKELRAFAKPVLEPGEQRELTFRLEPRDFASYDTRVAAWRTDSGEFDFLVGASSRDIRLQATVALELPDAVRVPLDRLSPLSVWLATPATRERIEPALAKVPLLAAALDSADARGVRRRHADREARHARRARRGRARRDHRGGEPGALTSQASIGQIQDEGRLARYSGALREADCSTFLAEQGCRRGEARMAAVAPMRVIIVDDDPYARRVIKAALQANGVTVIAEAKNGREAVELGLHYRPDVVLMDVIMPGLDGILATRRILREHPEQLVVALTSAGEEEFGPLALQAGAVGYLSKDVDIGTLTRTLRGVMSGEGAVSRAMTLRLIERFRGAADSSAGLRPIKSPLTAREWEVIDLLQLDEPPDARRRAARHLPRDGAFPHQEHHAEALGPHAGGRCPPPLSACGSAPRRPDRRLAEAETARAGALEAPVSCVLGADDVHHGVDEGEVGERLREVARGAGRCAGRAPRRRAGAGWRSESSFSHSSRAASSSPISTRAETSQNEQIVNVPSSPSSPSSVSSTR